MVRVSIATLVLAAVGIAGGCGGEDDCDLFCGATAPVSTTTPTLGTGSSGGESTGSDDGSGESSQSSSDDTGAETTAATTSGTTTGAPTCDVATRPEVCVPISACLAVEGHICLDTYVLCPGGGNEAGWLDCMCDCNVAFATDSDCMTFSTCLATCDATSGCVRA